MAFLKGLPPVNGATPGVRDAPRVAKSHGVGSEKPSQNRTIGGEGQGGVPSVLGAALDLAKLGFRVFPNAGIRDGRCTCQAGLACDSPGKHPAIKGWQEAAATDPAVIRDWFAQRPHRNLGMPTGSGVAVLDVDRKSGGLDSLRALARRHGDLPRTVVQRTGGGGLHFLFALPTGVALRNSVGSQTIGIAPGLDIRGDGGQIVLPPSLHISGKRYRWDPARTPWNTPLALMPNWLLALALQASGGRPRGSPNAALGAGATPQGRPPEEWARLIGEAITEGGRNRAITALSGYLIHFLDPLVALSLVLAVNDARCRDPLSESEVVRTFESVARAELQKRKEAQRG